MFWRRKRSANDFSSEVEAHIELEADRLRAEGMSKEEASARARRTFGNVTQYQERFYESHRLLWLDHLRQDLVYAMRQLRRNKAFTFVAVATLALGIGANTAMFSVMHATLFLPLPYHNSNRLVLVWGSSHDKRGFSPPNFLDFEAQNQCFARMGAFHAAGFTLTGAGSPEQVSAGGATTGFFKTLAVHALLGRTFLPQESDPGHDRVAVLSYGLWKSRFGSDANILGKTILLDKTPYTVIGVLPQNFVFSLPEYFGAKDLWIPAVLSRDNSQRRHNYLTVIARLKPGVTIAQAQVQTNMLASRLEREYATTGRYLGPIDVIGHSEAGLMAATRIQPLHAVIVGRIGRVLWILFAAAGLVLLIACVNVANLQLAQVSVRRREIAVRAALGASRLRILRQLLTESVLLALLGGAVGIFLASAGVKLFLGLKPAGIPYGTKVTMDAAVLAYSFGISFLAGILFGIVPAFQRSLALPNKLIQAGARTSGGHQGSNRLRGVLMLSEVALSVILLISAGLLMRSFLELLQVRPGFRTNNILTLRLNLPKYSYPDQTQQAEFYTRLLPRLGALPGVIKVAAVNDLPLTPDRDADSFSIAGITPDGRKADSAEDRLVTPGYFQLQGIPLMKGRTFTGADTATAPGVVVISQSIARRFFPNRNPIGQRIKFGNPEDPRPWATIVGVVGDVRDLGLDTQPDMDIYGSYLQTVLPYNPLPFMSLLVHTAGSPNHLAPAVLDTIKELDKNLPLPHPESMESVYATSIAARRFNMLLLGLLAALALGLAALGIYGVISYSVARRTQEIGIRMALGAEKRDVLRLVIGQGMRFSLAGLGIGIIGALGVTRFLSGFLYGIKPTDPLTIALVGLLLSGVAFFASYIPARRAAKVDPNVALRYE